MIFLLHCGASDSEISFYQKELAPYDFPGDLFKITLKGTGGVVF
jgi:hypothetical protein